jgi:ribosome maturation factor RimP
MTHPLIPPILELAAPLADSLGLEVINAVFQTHQSPPVLRIDIRNRSTDETSLNDCERMSLSLDAALETSEIIPDAYVLEVSSPGVPQVLTSDREFISFRGFPVEVLTHEPHKGQTHWNGNLVERDAETVRLNVKGRSISIPRSLVTKVQLVDLA